MKKIYYSIVFVLVTISIISITHNSTPNFSGTFNPQLYPNKSLTPGLVATTDFKELTSVSSCGTYSKCHRKTTSSMKAIVCKEYPQNCTDTQEYDHFVPIALGGADDVRNLWAEPEHVIVNGQDLGFRTKDKLEAYLVNQMKSGKISPKDAQNCILSDWIACYKKYLGKSTFGALEVVGDPDN